MLERFIIDVRALERLRRGPVGVHLDAFCEWALDRGYAHSTIRQQIGFLGSFNRWLEQSERSARGISESVVDEFLAERQRHRGRAVHKSHRTTLLRFLEFMRSEGKVAEIATPVDLSPIAELQRRYEAYLRVERGLTSATAVNYLPFAGALLTERFGDEPIRLRELASSDISGFVLRHAHSMSPGRAKLMVSAFRSFLTFLFLQDETKLNLAPCVPTVADWRLSAVPKFLKPEEIERVLATCDINTAVGRRNYAILLLLARLGLRAGEIVGLELNDINWRAAEITIRGKGSSIDRLPLPASVGESLARYIHDDRPRLSSRRVFIRARAPLMGFANSNGKPPPLAVRLE